MVLIYDIKMLKVFVLRSCELYSIKLYYLLTEGVTKFIVFGRFLKTDFVTNFEALSRLGYSQKLRTLQNWKIHQHRNTIYLANT